MTCTLTCINSRRYQEEGRPLFALYLHNMYCICITNLTQLKIQTTTKIISYLSQIYEFPSHHWFKHFSLNSSLRTSGYAVEDDFLVAFDDCYKLVFQRLQGWTNLTRQHILKSFSQNRCHIHSQSDLLNTCSDYSLEACSRDETLQGTSVYSLTFPTHYRNKNVLPLGNHKSSKPRA